METVNLVFYLRNMERAMEINIYSTPKYSVEYINNLIEIVMSEWLDDFEAIKALLAIRHEGDGPLPMKIIFYSRDVPYFVDTSANSHPALPTAVNTTSEDLSTIPDTAKWIVIHKTINRQKSTVNKEVVAISIGISVLLPTLEDQVKMTNFLRENEIDVYTTLEFIHLHKDKSLLHIVIRDVPKEIDVDDIKADLLAQNYPVHEVYRMWDEKKRIVHDMVTVSVSNTKRGRKIFQLQRVMLLDVPPITQLLPAIIIPDIEKWIVVRTAIDQHKLFLNNQAVLLSVGISVLLPTLENYEMMTIFLHENDIDFYTSLEFLHLHKHKSLLHILIREVPKEIDVEDIKADLLAQNYPINVVYRMRNRRRNIIHPMVTVSVDNTKRGRTIFQLMRVMLLDVPPVTELLPAIIIPDIEKWTAVRTAIDRQQLILSHEAVLLSVGVSVLLSTLEDYEVMASFLRENEIEFNTTLEFLHLHKYKSLLHIVIREVPIEFDVEDIKADLLAQNYPVNEVYRMRNWRQRIIRDMVIVSVDNMNRGRHIFELMRVLGINVPPVTQWWGSGLSSVHDE